MGKIIPIPDFEYRCWVNRNKEVLEELIVTGYVSRKWLDTDKNKEFVERYFREMGYSITF